MDSSETSSSSSSMGMGTELNVISRGNRRKVNKNRKIKGAGTDWFAPFPGANETPIINLETPDGMHRHFFNGQPLPHSVEYRPPRGSIYSSPMMSPILSPTVLPPLSPVFPQILPTSSILDLPTVYQPPIVTLVKNEFGVPEMVVMPSIGSYNIHVDDIKELLGIKSSINLNEDSDLQYKMAKYIRLKILDKWIYKELFSILGYLEYKDDKVKLVNSIKDYKEPSSNEPDNITEKKISYLEHNIIGLVDVFELLSKFTKKYDVKWYYINKYDEMLIPEIGKFLKHLIEEKIEEKQK